MDAACVAALRESEAARLVGRTPSRSVQHHLDARASSGWRPPLLLLEGTTRRCNAFFPTRPVWPPKQGCAVRCSGTATTAALVFF